MPQRFHTSALYNSQLHYGRELSPVERFARVFSQGSIYAGLLLTVVFLLHALLS